MPLFELPTASSKPDTYASAYRVDEINPSGAISQNGGGSVTFEVASPSGNWFVPKLSFFEFRLQVLTSGNAAIAATAGAVNTAASDTGDGIQFAEYPASHLVETYSHSINGASLETISDCAELSAIQSRTMLPQEYAETFADTFRMRAPGGKPNSITDADVPGGALQPWDGTTEVFSCAYQPPGGIWKYGGSIPGMRQRIVLSLTNTLTKAVMAKSTATLPVVKLLGVKFYAAHVVPELPIAPPRNVVLSLPMMALVKQTANGSNQTLTFSVAPSTDKVYAAVNAATATGAVGTAAHEFQKDVKAIEFSYAGQRFPSISYGSTLASGHAERDISRAFLDYAQTTGRLFRSQGMVDNETTWANRMIFGASFEKPANDQSTNLIVRCNTTSAGNLCLAYQHHKICVLRYGADGLCEGCDVQENLT